MSQCFKIARPGLNLAALLVVASGIVQAAPILGTIRIGGEAEVTQTTIDYLAFIPGAPLNGTGTVSVISFIGSGIFTPLTIGELGTIVDRSVVAGVVPAQPAGVSINVTDWLTFVDPTFLYALDLKFINVGTFLPAACFAPEANGQTCTPPAPPGFESPYSLSNFNDANAGLSSNANFSVLGVVRNTVTGVEEFNFNGVFGAEFLGQSYQDVLTTVLGGGGVLSSYSATIDITAIPEPSTAILTAMGAAFAALGVLRRRRRA